MSHLEESIKLILWNVVENGITPSGTKGTWSLKSKNHRNRDLRKRDMTIKLLHTTYNYLQNIFRPIYKIAKVELLWRVSWLILSSFLTPFSDFYFWKENWALGYTSTRFWCSLKISSISKFLSFKSFSRYWGDTYIQFLVI